MNMNFIMNITFTISIRLSIR